MTCVISYRGKDIIIENDQDGNWVAFGEVFLSLSDATAFVHAKIDALISMGGV